MKRYSKPLTIDWFCGNERLGQVQKVFRLLRDPVSGSLIIKKNIPFKSATERGGQ